MFLRPTKELKWLLIKGMSNIYLNSFCSISWIFLRSVKEIIRFISKGMLTFPKLRFSRIKGFVSRPVFGELQLTQILPGTREAFFLFMF